MLSIIFHQLPMEFLCFVWQLFGQFLQLVLGHALNPVDIQKSFFPFSNHVNPKIIQRKARHKRIESTLRYDHTTDAMVMEHWDKMQPDVQVPQDDPVASKPVDHQPMESTPADGSSADQNPRKTCSILVDHEPDGQKKDYLQHNLDRYLNTA
ncbi:MAG: hypothetical protein ACP5FL_08465 [Thermoplasmatota archaeon]